MRILVASDGSAAARGALDMAVAFPWAAGSRARGVVALGRVRWIGQEFHAAMIRALHASAEELDRELRRRWPKARVFELHDSPAQAICSEARRFRADAIVLGWRGHGTFARLLAGSVSRGVAEQAKCSVLVVREGTRAPAARRFVVGFDGSANSRKAIRFLARLAPPRANRAVIVNILEPLLTPPLSRATAEIRAQVREAVARQAAARLRRAEKRLDAAVGLLTRRGWHVSARLHTGDPLHGLLAEASRANADVLVVGARGASGVARVLLGSVASGALNYSPIPVLIAR
jgi:nucleotide-binding universal stress UspA family protein